MTFTSFVLLLAGLALTGLIVNRLLLQSRRERKDARPPYIVALGALADGDEESAFRELKNAVRLDSSNADAYLRLGELFLERGDATRAHHLHRELATRSSLPREIRARVHRALARDLLALGKIDRAAQAAEESARLDETVPGSLETLLDIRERLGDFEGAFKVKKELVKRTRAGKSESAVAELATYRAQQGWTLLERGDAKGAERLVREAQRLHAECRRASYVVGLLLESDGDYAGAIRAWESLLREDPEEAPLLFRNLERASFLDGSFSRMEHTYGSFLQRFPDHPGASFGLAHFLRRKGQLDEALDVCRRALETHPDAAELRALALALLLQSGRVAQAESAVDEWISKLVGRGEGKPTERVTPLAEKSSPGRTR